MAKLKELLRNKLSKSDLDIVPTSFDIVGSIAIFSDFPAKLRKHEKLIAESLMKANKNIRTVAKKTSHHKGRYRTKKIKILAGEKTKVTIHKESNALVKLNVETCYFSPRLSAERLRIANMVKPKESVLVMFSGVCIYPLVIARNAKPKEIYAVELNPEAHKYAIENIKLNKANNITALKGDIKKVIPRMKNKFDRIVMPLPKTASSFLGYAMAVSKKGTVIHFYDFQPENEFEASLAKIRNKVKNFKLLSIVKCGQFSPRIYRICIDFKVS